MNSRRTILVMTIVHHPDDARIRHRQIAALLEDGWSVVYAAPFVGYGASTPSPSTSADGLLRCIDLPRARGRRRLGAVWAAARLLRQQARHHDLVLVHDIDLLLAVLGTRARNVVWDV